MGRARQLGGTGEETWTFVAKLYELKPALDWWSGEGHWVEYVG